MTRRIYAALCALVLSGAPAAALVVRTGDHAAFTRVVVPVPTGVSWQLSREGDIIVVQMSGLPSALDISTVFDRIGRDRISAITVDGTTLQVTLNCRCVVESFVSAPRLLVIDVLDDGDDKATETRFSESVVTTLLPDPVTDTSVVMVRPDGPMSTQTTPPNAPNEDAGDDRARLSGRPEVFSGRAYLEELGRSSSQDDATAMRLADGLGAALSQALTQVGDDGVLNATGQPPVDDGSASAWQIRPVFDDPTASGPSTMRQVNEPDLRCIPDEEIDLTAWARSDDFLMALSTAQMELLDPNGRADPKAAAALARVYLRFGLPSEALDVLPMAMPGGAYPWLTKAIAELMSGQPADASNQFVRFVTCPSDVAFWAFLAAGSDADLLGIDTQALLRGFFRLPVEVQAIMAVPFQTKLRLAGLLDLAEETRLASLSNPNRIIPPDPGSFADLLETDAGDRVSDSQRATYDGVPLFAAISEVTAAWDGDGTLRPGIVELVASYAAEHRTTPFAPTLNLTTLRAHLLANQFDDAFAVLTSSELGDLRADAEESFVLRMQQDLSGFELAKFRYQLAQSDISEDLREDILSNDLSAVTLRPQNEPVASVEPIESLATRLDGEPDSQTSSFDDAPSLEAGEAILRDSLSLRETLRNVLFAE